VIWFCLRIGDRIERELATRFRLMTSASDLTAVTIKEPLAVS